jgi:protein-S-isoprenylcysteine O-methyltransferase Ste14
MNPKNSTTNPKPLLDMSRFMPGPSLPADIIPACWILFCVIWLLAAASTKRSIYRESGAQRLRYWILLVLAFLLLTKRYRLPYPLHVRIISSTDAVQWMAAILCLLGLAFCVWARATLGRNWSGTITLKEGHELIERGPYRFVRHPIYTGLLAMFFATAIAYGHLGGFVAVVLAFASFWIKLKEEENLMLQQFPDQYRSYQQRVKCIIPFVL